MPYIVGCFLLAVSALPHTHSRAPFLVSGMTAGHTSRHPGNERHNQLVRDALNEFSITTITGPSWADIKHRIKAEIRLVGGRYLRWKHSTGVWTELGEEEILRTIDQAMRSRLRKIRHGGIERPVRPVVDALHVNDYMLGRGGTWLCE